MSRITEKDVKKFKEFLVEQKALEAYEQELQDQRELTFDKLFEGNLKDVAPMEGRLDTEDFIDSVFYWDSAKKGYTYWNELDEKWQKVKES